MYKIISNCAKANFLKNLLKIWKVRNATIARSIMSSPYGNIEIPNSTVPEFIFQSFDKYPNEVAVECSVTRKKYTFDELRIKSRNFNQGLRKKLKLNKGDVVAILLPNVPDFPICVLGAIQAGLVVTTINPAYTPEEISYQLSDTDAKVVITLGSMFSTVKAAGKILKRYIPTLTVKMKQEEVVPLGGIDINELFETTTSQVEEICDQNVHDTIILPYSSGTTGLPKGVELTHYNVVANISQVGCDAVTHLPVRTGSHTNVVPAILPFFHIYGLSLILFLQLHRFSKIVCVPKFTSDGFVNLLSEHKPNILYLVPPIVSFMSTHPSVRTKDLNELRTVVSGGAPLGKSDEERFLQKFGNQVDILQGLGLTETSPAIAMSNSKSIKKFGYTGSCGLVLPNTSVKIISTVDSSIELLGANEKGEILVKGPQVMKRYFKRPKETQEVFLNDWIRTGDLGQFDENGLLYVSDRLKELIKVKGFQVAPAELEVILRTYEGVLDAAVIGVPDDKCGEVPLAYIVPQLNTKIDVKNLSEYVSKKVASYKQLKGGVILVDSLPKTASGKLLRKNLKLQYQSNRHS